MVELSEAVDSIAAKLDDIHFNSRHGSWIDSAKEIVQAALVAERNRTIEECAAAQMRPAMNELRRLTQSPYFWMGFRDGAVLALIAWSVGLWSGWMLFG